VFSKVTSLKVLVEAKLVDGCDIDFFLCQELLFHNYLEFPAIYQLRDYLSYFLKDSVVVDNFLV
jgi:hypothetical protein